MQGSGGQIIEAKNKNNINILDKVVSLLY